MPKYEVAIDYKGLCNFVIEAKDSKEAVLQAIEKFRDGVEPDVLGNEREIIERCVPTLIEIQSK